MSFFLNNMIFDDTAVNKACDDIVSLMTIDREFPERFVLSGKAAYQLQDGITSAVNNIVFATDDFRKYFKLSEGLRDLGFINIFKYQKFIEFQLETNQNVICFEIWNLDVIAATVDYKGIALLHKDLIDKKLL